MGPLYFDIMARDMTAAAFKSVKASADRLGREFQSIGAAWSTYVTAPIAAFGGLTVKTAGDFEEAMNSVDAAAGGLDTTAFDELRAKAVELGAATQYSATEGANAIEMLIKNGLDAKQVMEGAADAAVRLAGATGGGLAPAADVTTDVMQQFGKAATELGDVADQVSGTMVASKLGFDDYRLAIGQAGGVAGKVGVTFEDFNAALAATSSSFASGSDAGTSFKTFLQRLVPSSDSAANAMDELGLQFFDASGNMKSMADIAEELKTGLAGLSDEAKISALTKIFGQDAIRTAIALGEQGADGIKKYREAIASVSADAQAEARMRGFNGAMRELSGAFETLQIAIGDSGLLQWATEAVQGMTDFVRMLAAANPELLKWGTILAGVAAAIGPVLVGLGLFVSGLSAVMGVLAPIGAAIVGAIVSPFGLVAGAIVGAAAVLGVGFDDIGAIISSASAAIGPALAAISDHVVAAFADLPAAISGALDGARAGLGDAAGQIGAAIGPALDALGVRIRDGLGVILEAVGPGFQAAATVAMDALKGLAAGFASSFDVGPALAAIGPALDTAGVAFTAFAGAVSSVSGLLRDLVAAFSAALESLTGSTLGEWLASAGNGFRLLGETLGIVATQLLALPFETLRVGFTLLGEAFNGVSAAAAAMQQGLAWLTGGTVVADLQAFGAAAQAALGGMWDQIVASVAVGVERVVAEFEALATKAIEAIGRLVTGVTDWMIGKLGAVWDSVGAKLKWMGDQFYNLYDAVVGHSYVPDLVDGVETEMVDRLGGVWDSVGTRLTETGLAFGRFARDAVEPVRGAAEETDNIMRGMGSRIVGGLKNIFRDGKVSAEEFRDLAVSVFEDMLDRILDKALKPLEDALDGIFENIFGGGGKKGGAPLDLGGLASGKGGIGDLGGLFDGLVSGLGNMISGLVSGLGSMLSGLFSSIGGGLSGLLSGIFSIFGGLFADGGTLGAGQWGIVGERGPEILAPAAAPRRISPISMGVDAARGGAPEINLSPTIKMEFSGYMSREDVKATAEAAAKAGTIRAVEISRAQIIPTIQAYQRDGG